ncbi:MAG TPA: HIT family protein [Chlamydiales bacterium]|nr:HIT family protein [Chlamydiales bacterium]
MLKMILYSVLCMSFHLIHANPFFALNMTSIPILSHITTQDNMTHKNDCIFCQIIKKETKSWVIWESPKHIAFLSIYPNMRGVTVVAPKIHRASYAFGLENEELVELLLAAKAVAKILDSKLEGVGRTALVLEGFGVDHVHAKLYPLPNTAHTTSHWQPIISNNRQYFDQYPGYVSSNDSNRAPDEELDRIARILTETQS